MKEFERMQKLVFGKILLTENTSPEIQKAIQAIVTYKTLPSQIDHRLPFRTKADKAEEFLMSFPDGKRYLEQARQEIDKYYEADFETGMSAYDYNELFENKLKAKIKELVHSSLGEAKKKKKEEDVAPQEDIDLEMDTTEEIPVDTMAPESSVEVDIDPKVKAIQDALNKALANAQALNDEKLVQQIGNTITMLVRTQVVGQQEI